MVVIPAQNKEGHFIVVEGNRRLGALKLLTDPLLRNRIGADDFPQINDPDKLKKLTESIPIVAFQKRKEIVPYLGFRHITGIKTWNLYAKAKYIASLVENDNVSLEEISNSIGDISGSVRGLYRAYLVLKQVRSLGVDDNIIRSEFSFLVDAISSAKIKKFLDMPVRSYDIKDGPVQNLDHLRLLIEFIFGDRDSGHKRVIEKKKDIVGKFKLCCR